MQRCTCILLFLVSIYVYGQKRNDPALIDSLQKILTLAQKEDTFRGNILIGQAMEFVSADADSSIAFSKPALSLSENIKFDIGIASRYYQCGRALSISGKNTEAFSNFV